MNEEEKAATTDEQQETAAIDWKAEARKWEARAKASKKELAELAQKAAEADSKAEELAAFEEKAAATEKELAELRAEKQHAADVAAVSKETGVPSELLSFLKSKDEMKAFAEHYGHIKPAAASTLDASRLHREGAAKPANRDLFADEMRKLLGN